MTVDNEIFHALLAMDSYNSDLATVNRTITVFVNSIK